MPRWRRAPRRRACPSRCRSGAPRLVPSFRTKGGFIFARASDVSALVIRGIGEEIEIRLDVKGVPFSGRRRTVSQGWIARVSKYEFKSIAADLTVASSDFNDFSELAALLEDTDVQEALGRAKEPKRADVADEEEPGDREELGDVAEDALVEEIVAAPAAVRTVDIDVPELWRSLIGVEAELTTEGRRAFGRLLRPQSQTPRRAVRALQRDVRF